MESCITSNAITTVILLAGRVPLRRYGKAIFEECHEKENIEIAESMAGVGRKAEFHLVFVSSQAVYAPSSLLLSEDAPKDLDLKHLYGRSKIVSECLLHEGLEASRLTILRPSIVYGPGSKRGDVTERLIRGAIDGRRISLEYGSGSVKDFIFVDDVVEGLIGARKNPGTFKIGAGFGVRIDELVSEVESLMRAKIDVVYEGKGDDYAVLNTHLIKSTTGFVSKTKLQDGLLETSKTIQQLYPGAK